MKHLCIITNKYPNPIEPNVLVFVQQLVWSLVDNGVKCSVICPMPVNINPKYLTFPDRKVETTENGNKVEVFMPKYIGFGQTDIFNFNPAGITTKYFTKAVSKVIKKMNQKPDAVYGHFVTPAGIAAARIGREYDIPSFMAHGEATFMTMEHFGFDKVERELESLSGVVAVSTQNKNMLTSVNAVIEDKIKVIPNGFRPERFYPRSKIESREKFGLPKDKFIVAFVGSFDHRKGSRRLDEAVDQLDSVYSIYAGKGEMPPQSTKCLYQNTVNNEDLPYFYSAADAFVLPTLNEGCCNAIIEAMACGLPIVSSNRPFNDDILDESCSIRIDPESIKEIKQAVSYLKNNGSFLDDLRKGSVNKSKHLTLDKRARAIENFINSQI